MTKSDHRWERPVPKLFVIALLGVFLLNDAAAAVETTSSANPEHRQWVENMKVDERGPFARIRWFCSDGSVLPPRPYACKDHGGGHQHGEWNAQATQLRDEGYWIANILAGMDAAEEAERNDFVDR